MAAGWNARNIRIAEQMSKTSLYTGKAEVEHPPKSSIWVEDFSIREEEADQSEQEAVRSRRLETSGKRKEESARGPLPLEG